MTPAGWKGLVWDIGTCMFTGYDGDGFPELQAGVYGGELGSAQPLEHHSLFGFFSRPLDPEGDVGCQVLYAWEGNRGHALPLGDSRVMVKVPTLPKGSSVQYAADGGFGSLDAEKHTWTLYVPVEFGNDGTPTKAHAVTVGKDGNGKRVCNLLHADGWRITMLEGDGVVIANAANDAWVAVNEGGVEISGNVKINGNIGIGVQLSAWLQAVNTALQALGFAMPTPQSLTA